MNRKKTISLLVLIILFSLSFYLYKINYTSRGEINSLINKSYGKTLNSQLKTKIKSGNLVTDYSIDEAMEDIDKFQLNTLNVPIAINIDNAQASDMSIIDYSKQKAIDLLNRLKGKKINIILEPYPWIANGKFAETDWNPSNINDFFNNWKSKVLKPLIDDIAIPYHVDALNIGTSFEHMEGYEKAMCDMVDYARKYYKGLITYRTNHWNTAVWDSNSLEAYNKKLNNNLFLKLDFISIAAYFELTENAVNSQDKLSAALESTEIYGRKQNVKGEIKKFYDKYKKPIFFGELGFPRTEFASKEPWNPLVSKNINEEEQANCFAAYRKVFEKESWNIGFSVFALGKADGNLYYPGSKGGSIIKNWYK
ncbi:hydrolase [Clostridium sp. 19966]|uniref:glycoside hydrolase family 113 n=1 Tax=Clostridium sp. 19966 TaxID=2768166 RepID=UPI0028DF8241|nr:hydrolase [Clostridium sp. 19966]MDT8719283.1 hydrolase [Clostridium sp. 19966]